MKLKWYLLRQNKCPKCSHYLQTDKDKRGKTILLCDSCLDFSISEARFREIVSDSNKRSVDSFMDAQEKKREGWE